MFDQKFHWNVSEIAIFLEYENPQILFYWPFFRFIKYKYGKKIKQHEMKNNYYTYTDTPKIWQILEVFPWNNFNKHKPLISVVLLFWKKYVFILAHSPCLTTVIPTFEWSGSPSPKGIMDQKQPIQWNYIGVRSALLRLWYKTGF